jgi:mono/diheme cytochrome c family protein
MRLHTSVLSFVGTAFVTSSLLACNSGSSATPGDDAGQTPLDSSLPSSLDSSSADSSSPAPDSSSPAPDSSSPEDASPASDGSSPEDSSAPADAGALSFGTSIYAPLIAPHCTGCHGFTADGGPGVGIEFGKLDLSSADAGYANLVNVPAAGFACSATDGASPLIRVVPGSADTSLLYEKVNGFTTAPPCGGAMPKSGEIPDGGQAILVDQIGSWINEGANP